MTYEHDGCVGCKWEIMDEDAEPCRWCKGTAEPRSDEKEKRPDYYYPADKPLPTAEDFGLTPVHDAVEHPSHYCKGGIECIDAIRASMSTEAFKGYCKGNVMKYIFRYEDKGGKEDLGKAAVYLKWLIETVSENV